MNNVLPLTFTPYFPAINVNFKAKMREQAKGNSERQLFLQFTDNAFLTNIPLPNTKIQTSGKPKKDIKII